MKTQMLKLSLITLIVAAFAVKLNAQTAFTYQGWLKDSGSPANGAYDFRFRLASDPLGNNYIGSPFLTNGVPVTNGLFTAPVDFGAGAFTGSNYWLEVDVRPNGGAGYTALSPLQAFTPTPYALFAKSAGNLAGADSPKAYTLDISGRTWTTVGTVSDGYLSLQISAPNVLTSDVVNNWVVLVYVKSTDFGPWALVPYYTERNIRVTADVRAGYIILKRDQGGAAITQSSFSAVKLVLIKPISTGTIN